MNKRELLSIEDLSREERDIARRWCILNCWGWPPDLPKPPTDEECRRVANGQMAKAVRAIGMRKILLVWNEGGFSAGGGIVQEYGFKK